MSGAPSSTSRRCGRPLLLSVLLFCAWGTPAGAYPELFIVRPSETMLRLTYAAPGETVEFIAPPVREDPANWAGEFQWFWNGAALAGQTTATLTLTSVTEAHAGNYRLRFTAIDGSVEWSQTMPLNVSPAPGSGVDPTFSADLPEDADLPAVFGMFPDGSYLVEARVPTAEERTSETDPAPIGRSSARDRFNRLTYYHLRGDGSRDTAFSLPESAGRVLALLPDGSIVTRQAPYRFSANGTELGLVMPAGWSALDPLKGAATGSDGVLYLAQGNRIGRWAAPYSTAASFYVDPAADQTVVALAVDGANRVLAETRTPQVQVPAAPPFWTFQRTLLRLLADGSVDPSFHPGNGTLPAVFAASEVVSLPLPWSGYVAVRRFTTASSDARISYYHDDGTPRTDLSGPEMLGPNRQDAVAVSRPLNQSLTVMRAREAWWQAPTPAFDGVTLKDSGYAWEVAQDCGVPDLAGEAGFRGWTSEDLVQPYRQPNGAFLVGGRFTGWDGHHSPKLVRLFADGNDRRRSPFAVIHASGRYEATWWDEASPGPAQPQPNYVPNGDETLTLTCELHGLNPTAPYSLEWLALDGQPLPANRTGANLVLGHPKANQLGRYQVRLTVGDAKILSSVLELTTVGQEISLSNLSTRVPAEDGDATAVAGFVLAKPGKMLLRAVGPELQTFGVTTRLETAGLRLFDAAGAMLAAPPLGTTQASRSLAAQVGAFGLDNASGDTYGSTAMVADLAAGPYSIHLQGKRGPTGNIGLLELYAEPTGVVENRLRNLSVRTTIGTAESPVSVGFVVNDPQQLDRRLRLLVRAVGPGLAAFGIENVAIDPMLQLHDASGAVIARQDDGSSEAGAAETVRNAAAKVGAFTIGDGSTDAAIVVDLPHGVYTVTVTDRSDQPGAVVLVEVYVVPVDD